MIILVKLVPEIGIYTLVRVMFKCANPYTRVCIAHPIATEIIEIEKKGDEKMTMIEMKKYDDTKTNAMPTVAERLPSLEEERIQNLSSHEWRRWAHSFMADLMDGQCNWFGKNGVNIQRVDEDTVRCVSVTDHDFCFNSLACMRVTFESAGIGVQLDPYTVVTPYVEPPEEVPHEAPGVEVA